MAAPSEHVVRRRHAGLQQWSQPGLEDRVARATALPALHRSRQALWRLVFGVCFVSLAMFRADAVADAVRQVMQASLPRGQSLLALCLLAVGVLCLVLPLRVLLQELRGQRALELPEAVRKLVGAPTLPRGVSADKDTGAEAKIAPIREVRQRVPPPRELASPSEEQHRTARSGGAAATLSASRASLLDASVVVERQQVQRLLQQSSRRTWATTTYTMPLAAGPLAGGPHRLRPSGYSTATSAATVTAASTTVTPGVTGALVADPALVPSVKSAPTKEMEQREARAEATVQDPFLESRGVSAAQPATVPDEEEWDSTEKEAAAKARKLYRRLRVDGDTQLPAWGEHVRIWLRTHVLHVFLQRWQKSDNEIHALFDDVVKEAAAAPASFAATTAPTMSFGFGAAQNNNNNNSNKTSSPGSHVEMLKAVGVDAESRADFFLRASAAITRGSRADEVVSTRRRLHRCLLRAFSFAAPVGGQVPDLVPDGTVLSRADRLYARARLRELDQDACLSNYRWRGGATHYSEARGGAWTPTRPSDARLLLALFLNHMDDNMFPSSFCDRFFRAVQSPQAEKQEQQLQQQKQQQQKKQQAAESEEAAKAEDTKDKATAEDKTRRQVSLVAPDGLGQGEVFSSLWFDQPDAEVAADVAAADVSNRWRRAAPDVALVQRRVWPQLLQLRFADGGEWDVMPGQRNLFHALALFALYVKVAKQGALHHVKLDRVFLSVID